ncbi:DUF4124 domain-containing protein [Chitinimonas sp.]|uniref:DUF4124 domain-containing protein n=1 Tax=Chitinimonas sp. TaxID=1934313 RepID=UPI0035AF56D6
MMNARLCIATLSMLLVLGSASAQVYKWVDANGKTQFSDQPPPEAKAQAIKVKPASGGFTAPASTPNVVDAKGDRGKPKFDKKAAEENCRIATQNHQTAADAELLRVRDKNGEEQVIGAQGKVDEVERMRRERDRLCEQAAQ